MKQNERQNAGWDLKNAFGNYATLVVSQVFVAVFSFASVTLCTRILGAEGYGGIVAIIAASSVAQIFVNWTCVGLARFGVEEFVESGNISKSFWARTIIFLPNTVIFLLFSLLWFPLLANWLKLPAEAFWLVVLHFIVTTCWLHVQHAFQGAKLPKLQGSFLAFERILIFSTLAILAFTGNLTWISAVWAYIIPPFLMTVIGLWQIKNLVSWKIDFDREMMRKMLKFSIPLIPFSLIGYFSTSYLDAIFISQYLTKSDLGIYAVAYQISGILMQFPALAGSLLMPWFVTLNSTENESQIGNYLTRILPLLCFVWCIFCACFGSIAVLVLPFIFGESISNNQMLVWTLTSAIGLGSPYLLGYGAIANARSFTMIILACAVVSASVNIFLNTLLIPKFGLIGCGWATVIAYLLSSSIVVFLINRNLKLKRTWAIQATFPILIGSLFGTIENSGLVALSATIISSMIFGLILRKRIFESWKLIMATSILRRLNNG